MTSNQIEMAKAKETARHNRQSETSDRIGAIGTLARGVGSMGSAIRSYLPKNFNDVEIYNLNPATVEYSGKISYQVPLGSPVTWFNAGERLIEAPNQHTARSGFPGVMTLFTGHTIGANNDATLASRRIYSFVRFANSGSRNYEAPDYFFFLMQADTILTLFTFMDRIIRTSFTYNDQNWYFGKGLLRSIGFTDSFIRNLEANINDYAARLNILIESFNAISIPRAFNYFSRHIYLYGDVFRDGPDGDRVQLYQFAPSYYFVFDPQYSMSKTAGGLKPVRFTYESYTNFGELLDILRDQIDALLGMEDAGIMAGDSLKAFGTDKMFRLSPMVYPSYLQPIYSPEALVQIQGATVLGPIGDLNRCAVWQDNLGNILQSQVDNGSATMYTFKQANSGAWNAKLDAATLDPFRDLLDTQVINRWKQNQTPLDNIVATRLMVFRHELIVGSTDVRVRWDLATIGTEFVEKINVTIQQHKFNTNTQQFTTTVDYTNYSIWDMMCISGQGFGGIGQVFRSGCMSGWLSAFDWHPTLRIIYVFADSIASGSPIFIEGLNQVYDYAIITKENQKNMSSTANLSLWNISGGNFIIVEPKAYKNRGNK